MRSKINLHHAELRNLIGLIQNELRSFIGFELSVLQILLLFKEASNYKVAVSSEELCNLSHLSYDSLIRILRAMSDADLIHHTVPDEATVEIGLTRSGREILMRIGTNGLQV